MQKRLYCFRQDKNLQNFINFLIKEKKNIFTVEITVYLHKYNFYVFKKTNKPSPIILNVTEF